ncbi:hypothetical protein SLS61_005957 [Didymella pomorum]
MGNLSSTSILYTRKRRPVNTVKLELPSISSVHARGPVDTWNTSQYAPKTAAPIERLPQIQSYPAFPSGSSTNSSPRGDSISGGSVASSNTSYAASVHGQTSGFKTPSPEQTPQSLNHDRQPLHAQSQQGSPYGTQNSFGYPQPGYNSMNQMQSYADVHPPHMSAATAHAPASGPPTGLSHYAYPQQPSMLQPGPQYGSAPPGYPSYGYGNGVPSQLPASSSMNSAMVPSTIQLPAMSSGAPAPAPQSYQSHTFDHTGQVAPPGMKPRVTATLWEDEGSLCFQVEAKGVCVARREDNHMINGTKLLNVAGMTRGRRDGILKSEKTRHVVKIGPMHLKGVWIPFERALEFANKEKITESLYPLFVHDIGALLYHPTNQNRQSVGSAAMAAVGRPRSDSVQTAQRYLAGPTTSQPPALHHHHSMSNPIGAAMSQPPHAIQPNPSAGRPGLDRAHTFPTPPTSASSMMGMGNQGSSYEWTGANVQNAPSNQPLSIDTGLSNARSVPTTPATTPPGAVQQAMSYPSAQSYDGSRAMYSAPPSQPGQYPTQGQPMMGYRNDGQYPKTEMAPPSRITEVPDENEVKPAENNEQANAANGGEGDHEQDHEYTHSSTPYNGNRNSYAYNPNGAQGAMHHDHPHLSPEMTGSPHQNGSGRATPRTTTTGQAWSSGYPTPQRQNLPSSNLYSVMSSDPRAASNGNASHNGYPGPTQYASQGYPASNGMGSAKRSRDDEDQEAYRPDSVQSDDMGGLKRRKTMEGGAVGPYAQGPTPGIQRAHTMQAQPQHVQR